MLQYQEKDRYDWNQVFVHDVVTGKSDIVQQIQPVAAAGAANSNNDPNHPSSNAYF
jgi:hypothetical protein